MEYEKYTDAMVNMRRMEYGMWAMVSSMYGRDCEVHRFIVMDNHRYMVVKINEPHSMRGHGHAYTYSGYYLVHLYCMDLENPQ